jgi:tetratricopeptide (TPR) repeat protein
LNLSNRFVLRRLVLQARLVAMLLVMLACLLVSSRMVAEDDWQEQVRTAVERHQIAAALALVNHRLDEAPDDMEAHAWRGRLLAWSDHRQEAEGEYRLVLNKFPGDVDVLTGLADVLLWQRRYSEALKILEDARRIAPLNSEILVRRARLLALLERNSEARAQFQAVLSSDPTNSAATKGLASLTGISKYELRLSDETDFFNYTENAQVETVTLTAHWNDKWTSAFGVSPYYLFGENAVKVWAEGAYRFHQSSWVRVLGAGANPQDVVPEGEALIEYGHGFRFSNPWLKGLESSYQEHSLWYRGAQVTTINTNQIVYLPREWTWTLSVTGSHTRFTDGESDWVPSGSTKLGFPLGRRFSGSVLFAVGAENFAQVDQIGRLSARTYGGGLRYRFAESQDVSAFIARQDREYGQEQTSLGLSYGLRF